MRYVFAFLFALVPAVVMAQGLPVIVQKEVTDKPSTNVAIEQVDIIGSYRRLYDFDYDQLCTFYNQSANTQSGGGLDCRFYNELPPKVQKRYTFVCQQLSVRKDGCPQPDTYTVLPSPPVVSAPEVMSPSASVDMPPSEGEGGPTIRSGLPPKFDMLKRGKSFTVDELRDAKP